MSKIILYILAALFLYFFIFLYFKLIYRECLNQKKVLEVVPSFVFLPAEGLIDSFEFEGCVSSGIVKNMFDGRSCKYHYSIPDDVKNRFFTVVNANKRWRYNPREGCRRMKPGTCTKGTYRAWIEIDKEGMDCSIEYSFNSTILTISCSDYKWR